MIITIDTQKDSREEIKKAIRLLSSLAEEYEVNSHGDSQIRNIFDDASPSIQPNQPQQSQISGGLFGFLDNADQQVKQTEKEEQKEEEARNELIEYY